MSAETTPKTKKTRTAVSCKICDGTAEDEVKVAQAKGQKVQMAQEEAQGLRKSEGGASNTCNPARTGKACKLRKRDREAAA